MSSTMILTESMRDAATLLPPLILLVEYNEEERFSMYDSTESVSYNKDHEKRY